MPPLTPDEEEQAIREPAAQVGVRPEPGLVAELIADIAHQPGALPLLQYALTELFERRSGDRLHPGGLSRRSAVWPEHCRPERNASTLGSTPTGQRGGKNTGRCSCGWLTLGEGRPDTRRRVPLAELDAVGHDPDTVERVLDQYGRHRLLTFDREPGTRQPTAEVAHEAILTAWGRLREWIDEAREGLRLERQVAQAGAEWRGAERDRSFLLRGARLDQASTWAESTDLAVGSLRAGVPEGERGASRRRRR